MSKQNVWGKLEDMGTSALGGGFPKLIPVPRVRHGLPGLHFLRGSVGCTNLPTQLLLSKSGTVSDIQAQNFCLPLPRIQAWQVESALHSLSAYFLRASGPSNRKVLASLDLLEKT